MDISVLDAPETAATETTSREYRAGNGRTIRIDDARDAKLTDFGRETLTDRYLMPGENFQELFARVACAYSDDDGHAQRLYDHISNLWFMPATPVLSNGGTNRGLPISCFLNDVDDDLEGIVDTWVENVWLASRGGGIGSYWGNVRSIGERIGQVGKTSGIIPFIGVMDRLTLAISQGSLRRGSAAVYLPVHHPEIEEFLEIRKPSGDFNRKALNLHHAVVIDDKFMKAVDEGTTYNLVSPKDGSVRKTVNARALFQKILDIRIQTGEPYLLFEDTCNRLMPEHQRKLGLKVSTSNLCSEITLHTGKDHLGGDRTAVCCLSSLNLETYLEWKDDEGFVEDVLRFLDNVLQDFIDRAPDSMAKAKYAAIRERSVGMGVMGFHSFLQALGIPFESAMAKSWNLRIFKNIKAKADEASRRLAEEKGPCPDAADAGAMERFSHKMAIAPTASISIIAGGTSPGIEPIAANSFTHKTLSGSYTVRNRHLKRLLAEKGRDEPSVWTSITENDGSVQHLDFLAQEEKDVFKTAFELDQRWIIELAADRTPLVCQAQSVNLFLKADIQKWDLLMLHFTAWEKGMKSLYYCRSMSIQRAGFAGGVEKDNTLQAPVFKAEATNYDECLACQ